MRVALPGRDAAVVFDVRHADLYFFYDVDLVILAVEISGADLPLDVAQEMLHRFCRAYPSGWDEHGDGLNCPRTPPAIPPWLKDMGAYLDSDLLRRQSNIFLRLTVVTMIGLIGTTTTGFLSMSSLIAAADHHIGLKALYLLATGTAIAALTIYTVAKSQRIAAFLDALTIERLSRRTKVAARLDIWRKKQ